MAKFKSGELIRAISGSTADVAVIDIDSTHYTLFYENGSTQRASIGYIDHGYELSYNTRFPTRLSYEASRSADSRPAKDLTCVCAVRDLFNRGCQCGFLKPYKPSY